MVDGWESERTEQEVEALIDKVMEQENIGSKFPGMTYEQGIRAMYDWLNGDTDEDPMTD